MKENILVMALSICLFSSQAQNSFKLDIASSLEEQPNELVVLQSGSVILSYVYRESVDSPFNQRLVKISSDGTIIDEIDFNDPTSEVHLRNLINVGDTLIACIGEYKEFGAFSQVWYLGVDTSLNVIYDKKYLTDAGSILFARSFKDSDGFINSALTLDWNLGRILFIKSNIYGDTVFTKKRLVNGFAAVFDFFQHGFNYRLIACYSLYDPINMVLLDNNYNFLDEDNISSSNAITGKPIDSINYLLAGRIVDGENWDIEVDKLNYESSLLNYHIFGKPGDTLDFPAAYQCLDFVDPNRIFVAAIVPTDYPTFLYGTFYNWFYLNLFDSTLNISWTQYYGGDNYYFLNSVYATQDGGVIMTGSKYNYLKPENMLDVFVMKTNAQGLVTNISDPGIRSVQAFTYPNPGKDLFYIKAGPQLKGSSFNLYDQSGKVLIRKIIANDDQAVNTSNLSSGVYLWAIIKGTAIIETGKWVKD